MPLRRRTRIALAVGGALVALGAVLSIVGGWRPFGTVARPLAAIPEDADVAGRIDVAALRASPFLTDAAVTAAATDALGAGDGAALTDPLLGDDAAFALRDGSWLAVVRVAGPLHGARLGAAWLAATSRGDDPVREVTLAGDEPVYVARAPGLFIVSDDEDLAAEALETLTDGAASILGRGDLAGAFDVAATAALWVSDDVASYVVDALHDALLDAAPQAAAALPEAASPIALRVATAEGARGCEIAFRWRSEGAADRDERIEADLAAAARAIDTAAAAAPPPPPRVEPSDRVRVTIEVSNEGLSGPALRAEVDRRIADRAAARVAGDAAAARAAAARKAGLFRAVGTLAGRLRVQRDDVTVTLALGRE